VGPSLGSMASTGPRWAYDDLLADATNYLKDTTSIPDTDLNAQIWVVQWVHRQTLNIELTLAEAEEFSTVSNSMLIQAIIPITLLGRLVNLFGSNKRYRRRLTAQYAVSIREQIASGELTTLVDEGKNVAVLAEGLFDAFVFAAGQSVPGTISNFLGMYFHGKIAEEHVMTGSNSTLGLAIMETIRYFPPVGGVPYTPLDDNVRQTPVVAASGYDKSVYGTDARSFNIGRFDTFAEYDDTLLNWANAAVPLPDKPGTNHVCPARSLSYNMLKAYLTALNVVDWSVDGVLPRIPPVGNGPFFFETFAIVKT